MSIKTRKTIFYVLFGLFFLLGAAIVLYAQGWRFDLATGRAEKVGAIYVRSFPSAANIFLNGKPIQNQAGFLSQGTFLTDLFPKNYSLTLKQPGYADWHENAAVLPSFVTEFKYAVLVPQTPVTVATTTAKKIVTASGEIVVQTTANAIVWRGTTIGYGTLIGGSANFKNVIWKTAAGNYMLYDFSNTTSTDLSLSLPANIVDPVIDPYDATKIVAKTDTKIFIFDTARGTTTTVAAAAAGASYGPFALSPARIAWTRFKAAAGVTAVVIYDPFAKTTVVGSSTIAGKATMLAWVNNDLLAVRNEGGGLSLYDVRTDGFSPLASDVRRIAVAGDGSAIAALEDRSIEIFPVTDAQTYHRFNVPDVARATDVIWYKDAAHLFVSYADSVAFLDLADLGLQNFISVAKGTNPLYKPEENTLYLVNSSNEPVGFDFPS